MHASATEPPTPEPAADNPFFEELLWVHGMLRRDLEAVSRLAVEVADGMAGAELRAELGELKANGPLWRLKVNCLTYCRFVHRHHRAEDVLLFPNLVRIDPALAPVIERLESDHRRVAELLEGTEASARVLEEDESEPARRRVVAALDELGAHLLEHLAFEERSLEAPMSRLDGLR
jgi:hypothetical protein